MRSLKRGEEKKHLELLNLCFNNWGDEGKWRRLYTQPGFNLHQNVLVVEEHGEWTGGVTAWFREVILKQGTKVKVYIASDGFVHPNHRGEGVYSTFMRSANEFAQRRGACLGLGFISIYETPYFALPKYGFIDIFHPKTKILALHPEKFLKYSTTQAKKISLPKKFENVRLKLSISFKLLAEKREVTEIYQIEKGQLTRVCDEAEDAEKIDLLIRTDIGTLLSTFRHFYLRKRNLFFSLFFNLLTGRLRIRFSLNFVKTLLRP